MKSSKQNHVKWARLRRAVRAGVAAPGGAVPLVRPKGFTQSPRRTPAHGKKAAGGVRLALSLAALLCGSAYAQVVVPLGGDLNVPAGGMDLACVPLQVQGTVNVNAGLLSTVGNVGIDPSGVVNGGQGTITVGGNWSSSGQFNPGTGTVVFNGGCTANPVTISGTTVFNNLKLTSSTDGTFVVPVGTQLTVNGTLTLQGAPGHPLNLVSSGAQTAVITLGPNAQVVRDNVTQAPNVQIGAALAAIPTLSEWGLALLSLLVAAAAFWHGRKQRRRSMNHS